MALAPAQLGQPQATSEADLSPRSALVLAAWFGLVGGYIDLAVVVLKKDVLHVSLYYWQGRDFFWTLPLANLVILMIPGLVVAAANRLRPGAISLRNAAWLFATLAIWEPLLRMPLHEAASLLLAAGLGRRIGREVASRAARFRRLARWSLAALVGAVGATAAVSCGRRVLAESRATASLPAPPPGAKNVLLIVLDTVRAESLGLYGYARDTSPNLARWAKEGVRFDRALSPAPWTFPSHSSFFTGEWPYKLNAHWQVTLDKAFPTLAGYLAGRGYQTAGFVANTSCVSYESGLDRGFAHYEDYPPTVRTFLGSTVPGRWLVKNALAPRDFYSMKWITSQSRDARGINRAFLDWLSGRRRAGRPFFAFLNYMDAHEPFVVPEGEATHFGLRPESPRDYKMLLDYWLLDKLKLGARDVTLARDSYDDCIAFLDRQVGALLDDLDRRGVLRDTVVIVTSDHGEEFGEHGVFNHGYSLYLHEVHVPLLVISPTVPAGRAVAEPVSLRDLPATVVDLLGLAAGAPFPGRSLADHWRPATGPGRPITSPALSEASIPFDFHPRRGRPPAHRGYVMSLLSGGQHYLRDGAGQEELYDLEGDPRELHNLNKNAPFGNPVLSSFRIALLQLLVADRPRIGLAVGCLKQYRGSLQSLVYGRLGSLGPKPSRAAGGM
jgi:arylsulfatase A-like enzyme